MNRAARLLGFLCLTTALPACESVDPPVAASAFEAEVRGPVEASLRGTAFHGDDQHQQTFDRQHFGSVVVRRPYFDQDAHLTFLLLSAEAGGELHQFSFVHAGDAPLRPGTYALFDFAFDLERPGDPFSPPEGDLALADYFVSQEAHVQIYGRPEGSVTVEQATGGRLAGRFEVRFTTRFRFAPPAPGDDFTRVPVVLPEPLETPLTVTGTFDATAF